MKRVNDSPKIELYRPIFGNSQIFLNERNSEAVSSVNTPGQERFIEATEIGRLLIIGAVDFINNGVGFVGEINEALYKDPKNRQIDLNARPYSGEYPFDNQVIQSIKFHQSVFKFLNHLSKLNAARKIVGAESHFTMYPLIIPLAKYTGPHDADLKIFEKADHISKAVSNGWPTITFGPVEARLSPDSHHLTRVA